ncbi:MAG: hypothetical protein IPO44_01955 [Candidatus Microthrix sp.]|nr:hypothetical protein [Candidatus Microthrix sp.]MBK9558375.1 hypothetical protein [Candidatus Microthrix sp.]
MAKKRTELEARLLEEHGRVISVVQRWQSEQQAVDEARASLAVAEARLDEAVLAGAKLGDRSMVARLLVSPRPGSEGNRGGPTGGEAASAAGQSGNPKAESDHPRWIRG